MRAVREAKAWVLSERAFALAARAELSPEDATFVEAQRAYHDRAAARMARKRGKRVRSTEARAQRKALRDGGVQVAHAWWLGGTNDDKEARNR